MQKSSLLIVVAALAAGFAAGFFISRLRRETFDASKVRDPKVRAEMEYIKKMYFS